MQSYSDIFQDQICKYKQIRQQATFEDRWSFHWISNVHCSFVRHAWRSCHKVGRLMKLNYIPGTIKDCVQNLSRLKWRRIGIRITSALRLCVSTRFLWVNWSSEAWCWCDQRTTGKHTSRGSFLSCSRLGWFDGGFALTLWLVIGHRLVCFVLLFVR